MAVFFSVFVNFCDIATKVAIMIKKKNNNNNPKTTKILNKKNNPPKKKKKKKKTHSSILNGHGEKLFSFGF
jgi:hypothetical protein